MYFVGLHATGLRAAPVELADMGRRVDLQPGAAGVAVSDALLLWRGGLRHEALAAALSELEIGPPPEEPDEESGPLPDGAADLDPMSVRALVDAETPRRVVVEGTVMLDPTLYGRLRQGALRDPALIGALGASPTVTVRVGWLFNPAGTHVAVSVLGVAVGGVAFPVHGTERPAWMMDLLHTVAERCAHLRVDDAGGVAERMRRAMLSGEPEQRARYDACARALAAPPFGLAGVQIVDGPRGPSVAFGSELLRSRQHGVRAERALALAELVHLICPDVAVVHGVSDASTLDWLVAATEGAEATLEQVFVTPELR